MPLESSVQGVARAGKGRDDGDRHDRSPHDERATPALAGVGWEEVDPPIERMGDGQGQDERDDSPRDSFARLGIMLWLTGCALVAVAASSRT